MRKKRFYFIIPWCIAALIIVGCATGVQKTEPSGMGQEVKGDLKAASTSQTGGYLQKIVYNKMSGKERVTLHLSKVSGFDVARESDHAVIIKLADTFIPETLRVKQAEGLLNNIVYVLPEEKIIDGSTWGYIHIRMNKMVPYRIREDMSGYSMDFDVSTLPPPRARGKEASTRETKSPSVMKTVEFLEQEDPTVGVPAEQIDEVKKYTGERIALFSFQQANIKSVLRSIAEFGGVNIVSGPDVQGAVTIHMKDVPWDQALDTILEINGYGKKQTGSVITVLPLDKLKKAEEEQQTKDELEGNLRQISIEAKIVEINTAMARELGIRWGGGFQGTWNGRDIGMLAGNSATGQTAYLPTDPGTYGFITNPGFGIGVTDSHLAVNFPSGIAATAPALGLLIGTSKMVLDAQLSALETTGDGKIISSPRVVTLDNVKATIGQGEEIPYITTDKEGNRVVTMKDAKLELTVTPTITPTGKISMNLEASNKYADWGKTNINNENPPLIASDVQSKIVVNDGDTIVVGGIYKTTETKSVSGVPGLSKIPILGWLFKYRTKQKETRELLIFITPRIIREG